MKSRSYWGLIAVITLILNSLNLNSLKAETGWPHKCENVKCHQSFPPNCPETAIIKVKEVFLDWKQYTCDSKGTTYDPVKNIVVSCNYDCPGFQYKGLDCPCD